MNLERGDGGILPDGGESEESNGEETEERGESEADEQGDEIDGDEGTYALTITVEDEDGGYVQNATVTVEDKQGGQSEQQQTGSDGEASFRLENSDYIVEADSSEGSTEDQLAIDSEDKELTLTIVPDEADREPEEHELTVTVEDAEGDPIPQADLTVESDDMGIVEGLLDSAERQGTDSSGEAAFSLEDAEYTIEASTDGKELERTIEIDGENEEVTLTFDIEDEEEETEEAEEERGGPKEAEGDVSEDETESHGTARGTTCCILTSKDCFWTCSD